MPSPDNRDLVTYTVLVGSGAALTAADQLPQALHVVDIQVDNVLNKIPSATLSIADGNPYEQDFEVSNAGLLAPGRFIEIQLGYDGDNTTVFKGIIVANSHRIEGAHASLLVTCKHEAVRMTVGKKSRHYAEVKDSDVAEQLLADNGIDNVSVEPTGIVHEQLLQSQVSDWDFMMARLDVNGWYYATEGGKVIIKRCDDRPDPVATLTYGDNILAFDATVDARSQPLGVTGYAWDQTAQDVEVSEASDPLSGYAGVPSAADLAAIIGQPIELRLSGGTTAQALQLLADAKRMRQALAKIKGKISCAGEPSLVPGSFITLAGLGNQFNGKVFVAGVTHELGEGSWTTELTLGCDEAFFSEGIFPEHPVALTGQYAAMQGLQVGVVTGLEDPKGQGRIKIRMPIVSMVDDGIFARVATLDAGDNRGTFFLPEVGDEVVVGFLGDDANYPVVLGMLHSAAKPPPLTAADANDEKGYVSRSEIKILIHDADKRVSIQTPGGRNMVLDDANGACTLEDAMGNKLVLDDAGITLSAAKDLVLKATSSLSLAAPQLEIKADATAKLSGAGSLSVESSGITEIKGSMVKIN